jgi:hypothetical protein
LPESTLKLKEITAKKKAKDSVFSDLFSNKKNLLALYQTLHPEDTTATEDALEIVTIKNVLTNNVYNDLGVLARDDKLLLLLEAQATWTENILIRILLYLAQSYQEYFIKTQQSLYKAKKVTLPKPELYVIYVGSENNKPEKISLTRDFFNCENADIEITAKVICESKSDDIINQYILFCKVFNEQCKIHGYTETAVRETIRICRDRNILREYLATREKEVMSIMSNFFDEEEILKLYIQDCSNELAKEIVEKATKEITEKTAKETAERTARETARETAKDTARRLIKKGKMSLEEIADCIPTLSMDDLKEIEAEVMQLA